MYEFPSVHLRTSERSSTTVLDNIDCILCHAALCSGVGGLSRTQLYSVTSSELRQFLGEGYCEFGVEKFHLCTI